MRKLAIIAIAVALAGCQTDDEKCREYGAKKGSPEYINCRAVLAANEERDATNAAMAGAAMGLAAGASAGRR